MKNGKINPDELGTGSNDQDNNDSKNKELFDVINPYPAGHICFKLYEKTSPENKEKMRKNIKINARGNVEIMGREFIVLHAAPNGKDILEKNGVSFFLDDAGQREAKKQGYSLFTTQEEATTFINTFVGKDDKQSNKIGNMMRIMGLYVSNPNNGFWNTFSQKWEMEMQGYAALTQSINDPEGGDTYTFGVKCFFAAGQSNFDADTLRLYPDDGYPLIVSRPI